MRTGTANRMTRVRDQERLKARTRHDAMHIVRYRINIPEARDEGIQISLLKERMDQSPKKMTREG